MASHLLAKYLKYRMSDYYLPAAVFPARALFLLAEMGLMGDGAKHLSYQQQAKSPNGFLLTVIISHRLAITDSQ